MVSDRGRLPADLLDILTRLRLQPPDVTAASAVSRGQIDLLLARVSALTDTLRRSPLALQQEADRIAVRLLLADVALVVAQLRGESNELAATLQGTLAGLRAALTDPAAGDAP